MSGLPRKEVSLPLPLKIVAWVTILFGLKCAPEMVVMIFDDEPGWLHPGILQIPAGIGLLRLKKGWKTFVLVLHWLWFLVFLTARVDEKYPVACSVAPLPYMMWEYHVLTTPRIKALFSRTATCTT